MKYSLYVCHDGRTIGYCDVNHLLQWCEGRGVERPTESNNTNVYCVGCGKRLSRKVVDG